MFVIFRSSAGFQLFRFAFTFESYHNWKPPPKSAISIFDRNARELRTSCNSDFALSKKVLDPGLSREGVRVYGRGGQDHHDISRGDVKVFCKRKKKPFESKDTLDRSSRSSRRTDGDLQLKDEKDTINTGF